MYPKFWMGRPWTCMVSVLQGVNSVPKVLDGEALNMHGICSPRGEQCTQSSGWGGPEHAWYLFSKGWTVYPKFWMGRPWTCMVSVLQGLPWVNSVPKVLDGEPQRPWTCMVSVLQGVKTGHVKWTGFFSKTEVSCELCTAKGFYWRRKFI